jgi:hypothetical protein
VELRTLIDELKGPLYGLLAWVAGCVAWNVSGVILVANGAQGLGPTQSLTVAAASLVVGFLLWIMAYRVRWLFGLLAGLCALGAFVAVAQAITGDPASWPSVFWRWAGAALNSLGVLAGLAGVVRVLKPITT